MRRLGIVVALCALGALPAHGSDPWYRYDAMVTMSDSVALDSSLYIPSNLAPMANHKVPLIVRQHGGGSNKDSPYDVKYGLKYVESGKFALLTYSHRGHGNSGGLFDFFGERTTRDFSEMLDWVRDHFGGVVDTQDVGVSGYSQGGGESLLPAENDPRVRAAAVGNTFDSLNRALNPNDCYKLSFATGIFVGAYKTTASRTDDSLAIRWGAQLNTDTEDVGLGPVLSTTEDLASRSPLTYVRRDLTRPIYAHGLQIPVFWSNSWEDQLFPADHELSILSDLRSRGIPVHYWFASGGHAAGPNDPDDEAGKEAAMMDWMDEFLRSADHGYTSGEKPLVDYAERTGAGEPGTWVHHTASLWPVATGSQSWYATSEAALSESGPAHPGTVGTVANDLVSVNVAHDAISREILGRDAGLGAVLDAIPESKNPIDTATFTSPAQGTPFHVVGSPVVHVPVQSTALHVAQLDAKVWDFSGSGAQLVWRGCSSVSGPVTSFDFSLWPNAHTFLPGHQIVLTLSAVDFPTFKPDVEVQQTQFLAGTRIDLPIA